MTVWLNSSALQQTGCLRDWQEEEQMGSSADVAPPEMATACSC